MPRCERNGQWIRNCTNLIKAGAFWRRQDVERKEWKKGRVSKYKRMRQDQEKPGKNWGQCVKSWEIYRCGTSLHQNPSEKKSWANTDTGDTDGTPQITAINRSRSERCVSEGRGLRHRGMNILHQRSLICLRIRSKNTDGRKQDMQCPTQNWCEPLMYWIELWSNVRSYSTLINYVNKMNANRSK